MHHGKRHSLHKDARGGHIYVDIRRQSIPDPAGAARAWSCRHTGIGSDGLVLIGEPSVPDADFSMRIFNADGSEAMMCGNASRCIGKYVYERGLVGPGQTQVRLSTLSGVKTLDLHVEGGFGGGCFGGGGFVGGEVAGEGREDPHGDGSDEEDAGRRGSEPEDGAEGSLRFPGIRRGEDLRVRLGQGPVFVPDLLHHGLAESVRRSGIGGPDQRDQPREIVVRQKIGQVFVIVHGRAFRELMIAREEDSS